MPLTIPQVPRISRRDCLRFGAFSFLGLAARELFASADPGARAKSCILVWLNGGPSHLDTFDLKPDAPREVRGLFRPIPTSTDGLQICEHLPRLARLMDRAALIRSLTSMEGNHDRATHYMLTGWRPSPALTYPAMGSVVAKETGGGSLPRYIVIPDEIPYSGAGYLSAAFEPFAVGSNPARPDFRVRDLTLTVPRSRFERRRGMLAELEIGSRRAEADAGRAENLEQASRLLTSDAASGVFELARESAATRERYGFSSLGQSCLLARRLVEAGVRFIAVNDGGWDMHVNIFETMSTGFPGKLPELDLALSGLIGDLDERGLLAQTLVVCLGDFGRTPKLNSSGGRDHWPRASSVLLAGGGIRRGAVLGSTDAFGELPKDAPVTPEDLVSTVYSCLGIPLATEYTTPLGRPVRLLAGGTPIDALLA